MRTRPVVAILTIAIVIAAALGLTAITSRAQATKAALLPLSPNVTEGQLRVMNKDGQPIGQCPLKHTTVTADASGFVARVYVTQEFTNPMSEKIEAVYVFPLPQDAAVDQMEMTVGTRTIRGEIKRREEARQIYEAAKNAGHVASLLDQERPNIFTQSVANIMPGEKVTIKISYVDLLKYENGQYEFVFPMVVGPRYIPGAPTGKTGEGWAPDTNRVPDASKITPPVTPEGTRAGHDISVDLQIDAGVPIGKIESVLHEVKINRMGNNIASVKLADEATIPNKDFIVRYQVAGDEVRTGLLPNTRAAHDGYFSLVLVPPKVPTPAQIAPKEMIFVIDTSGSQQGWPIEKSKETMKLCVEQMNPGDTFQMLAFSNNVISLFDKPQPNNEANRALAQEFLSTRLGNGGTEMLKAVTAALTPPADPRRLRIVCFMTDGYVGNDFQILGEIQKNIGGARLFSFGIGNSVNRFLLDGMAEEGRGAVEYVTLAEQGSNAARKFYDRISKPVLTDIWIDWNGLPVEDVYPQRIPDLFSAKPVILKGRYNAAAQGEIVIHGKLGGKQWEQPIQVVLPDDSDQNSAMPSLWARAKIADLTAIDYIGEQNKQPDEKMKEAITLVALDYQLMSQYTSFVAVEEMTVTEGGVPKKVAVPVEMPEGVSYQGIFGEKGEVSGTFGRIAAKNSISIGAGRPTSSVFTGGNGGYGGGMSPGATAAVRTAGPAAKPPPPGTGPVNNSLIVRSGGDAIAMGPKGPAGPGAWAASGPDGVDIRLDSLIVGSDREEESLRKLKPEERKAYFIRTRLDPLLTGLSKKLDKNGDYKQAGKVEVKKGKVRVSIRLSDDSAANLAKLKKLGVQISASAKSVKMVVGWAPVAKLEELAQLDFVQRIAPVP